MTYGLLVDTDVPLPGLTPTTPADVAPRVRVSLADTEFVRSRFSGQHGPARTLATGDGPVRVRRGMSGDLLLDGSGVGLFHLSADGAAVLCATPDARAPAFRRMLLDTVLGTAGLQRGLEALHAAAVTVAGHLVAIAGPSGAGKSTLAVELIRGGGELFTDDLLFLTRQDGVILAHPGPSAMNLPEPPARDEPWRVIAAIGAETWAEIERPRPAPRRLSLLVVVDRRPGARGSQLVPEGSPAALLACALDSGSEPERLTRRLELLADLARTTPILRLLADPAARPAELAATVLGAVPGTVR